MLGRVLLAALLAGIAAGLIMGVLQHVQLTPLILEAETYEHASAHVHTHGENATAVAAEENDSGRTIKTVLTTVVAGAGFAAMLAGFSIMLAIPITAANGFVWGVCGFLAVSLAPAAGLPPELPGMPAADIQLRTLWWVFTIICTAAALWMIIVQTKGLVKVAGFAIAALPHIIGAPKLANVETAVPAELAVSFVANSLAANAVFWILLGLFLGFALQKFAGEKEA